ncbi:sugar transferase [Granulosicoccus sp. 3-233]|uniref:sugar transferase n=1 Tax=Granulosicoccus sp. 3-233 TaxID=3417969 RepID=UPI003D34AFA3
MIQILNKAFKRVLDFLVATFLLIVLSPVIALAAILVRIRLGSPVLFRQTRVGKHEKQFELMKFRSMLGERSSEGELIPENDRLTPFGRALRATSVDELPTLWLVLKGEMSLVGPRPLLVRYLPLYNDHQRRRHAVKPGITGWAQVNGRNAISWEEKFDLDVWYVENQSLFLDMRILLLTVKKVLWREDIDSPTHGIMEEFKGSGSSID